MPVNNFPPTPGMNPDHERMMHLLEENNKLLKQMRRSQKIGRTMQVLYWLVIVGLAVGAFYFLQPWIEQTLAMYSAITDNMNGPMPGFSIGELLELIPGMDAVGPHDGTATTTSS